MITHPLISGDRGQSVGALHVGIVKLGLDIAQEEMRAMLYSGSTSAAIRQIQQANGLTASGAVDEATANKLNELLGLGSANTQAPRSVQGTVLDATGTPLNNKHVRLFDREVGSREHRLGSVVTNNAGEYRIDYTLADLNADKPAADLVVRVFDKANSRKSLAESPAIFSAAEHIVVNLPLSEGLPKGTSEFREVTRRIDPLLDRLDLTSLDRNDIDQLGFRAKVNPDIVSYYLSARKDAKLNKVPTELLYGVYRATDNTSLESTLLADPKTIRETIHSADSARLIDAQSDATINKDLKTLRQLAGKNLVDKESGFDGLKTLMTAAKLTKPEQKKALSLLFEDAENLPSFFEKLGKDNVIGATKAKALRLRVDVNTLVANNPVLTEHLLSKEDVKERQDLARFTPEGLEQILKETKVDIPDAVDGEGIVERRKNYAKAVATNIELSYPTAVVASRWQDDQQADSDIARFFRNSPDYDFKSKNINTHLREDAAALVGINDKPAAMQKLRRLQNLFRITPDVNRFEPINAMWKKELYSAHAVKALGEETFVNSFKTSFGSSEAAAEGYRKAAKLASMTTVTLLRNVWDASAPNLPIIARSIQDGTPDSNHAEDLAKALDEEAKINWATLFGSLDFCECDHCQSNLSPAAYLFDLLIYLKNTQAFNREGVSVGTGLDELLRRRPDIAHIELSCQNTLTPLPYIDLVNEILEASVVAGNAIHQTEQSDPKILQASPEHIAKGAYVELSNAVAPWHLPFDLWVEEARAYLSHLGINRSYLMTVLSEAGALSLLGMQTVDGQQHSARDLEIASDALGICGSTGRDLIITDAANNPKRQKRWGIDEGSVVVQFKKSVSRFLDHAKMTYDELELLLLCGYVRDKDQNPVEVKFPEEHPCSLAHATFDKLDGFALDRIYRLLRLQKLTGWSFFSIDRLLRAVDKQEDGQFVVALYISEQIRELTGFSLEDVSIFWSQTLDTRSYVSSRIDVNELSIYERTFLNKAVFPGENVGSLVRERFALDASRSELVGAATNEILDDPVHVSVLLAACSIQRDDLSQIISTDLGAAGQTKLNLANVSHIYRVAVFAQSLDLSIADYYLLVRLTGSSPLIAAPAAPTSEVALASARQFANLARQIERSPFSLAEVAYLLTHDSRSRQALNLSDDYGSQEIKRIRRDLSAISEKAAQPDGSTSQDIEDGYLSEYLTVSLRATQHLLDSLTLPVAGDGDPESKTARQILSSRLFLQEGGNESYLAAAQAVVEKMRKAALILNKYGLAAHEQAFIIANSTDCGWMDFKNLPVTADGAMADDAGRSALQALMLFIDSMALGEQVFTKGISLAEFFAASVFSDPALSLDELAIALEDATGWTKTNTLTLRSKYGFSDLAENIKHANWIVVLGEAFRLLDQSGVDAEECWQWGNEKLSQEQAENIRLAANSSHEMSEWLEIAPGIRDPLREKQRDALLDFVSNKEGLTKDEIFAHFLIDTETNAVVDTSRIKLAISSVQLFVQRALMNIQDSDELDVRFSKDAAREWEWRKNYRVFEANRRVFLYPENWIYPELRDDKTPLFLALESSLSQTDITMETVEDAYLEYLYGLDRIANLQIAGTYVEKDHGSQKLHVVAKTAATPGQYYYRQWVEQRRWTPWEAIDASIDEEHVIPVVHNRRLFLFWPQYVEKAEPISDEELATTNRTTTHQGTKPKKYYEIRMAWSQLRNGTWSETKISKEFIRTASGEEVMPKESLYLFSSDSTSTQLYLHAAIIPETTNQLSWVIGRFVYNDATDSIEEANIPKSAVLGGSVIPLIFRYPFILVMPDAVNYYNNFTPDRSPSELKMRVDDSSSAVKLLSKAMDNWSVTIPHQYNHFSSQAPFFFADRKRTFFVVPSKYSVVDYETVFAPGNFIIPNNELYIFPTANEATPPPPSRPGPRPGDIDLMISPNRHLANSLNRVSDLNAANVTSLRLQPDSMSRGLVLDRLSPDLMSPGLRFDGGLGVLPDRVDPGHTPGETRTYKLRTTTGAHYQFSTHYHPYVGSMIQQVNRFGIQGLLEPTEEAASNFAELSRQKALRDTFVSDYKPSSKVIDPYPVEDIDFKSTSAYGQYNWEVFFHAPLFIADRLMKNQKYADAQRWFHYIFNPTLAFEEGLSADEQARRVWKIKPFYEYRDDFSVSSLVEKLSSGDLELEAQIEAWEQSPFNPHLVARMRIVAYMKTVVMKYVDNLLEWADTLFRRDSIESINEATQLYLLASQLLGKPPEQVSKDKNKDAVTFSSLNTDTDSIQAALESEESRLSILTNAPPVSVSEGVSITNTFMYFCLPANEKMKIYWERVADRLFKIRNGMNIEGIRRALALLERRIDPDALVRATAEGADLASAIAMATSVRPLYRFSFMIQLAKDFCSDVRVLGSSLLQSLEKKDAEGLGLLSARHQTELMKQVRSIKESSIEEAETHLKSLNERRKIVANNIRYFSELLEARSTPANVQIPGVSVSSLSLSDAEIASLSASIQAQSSENKAFAASQVGAMLSLIPDFILGASGVGGSPHSTVVVGGKMLAMQADMMAAGFRHQASSSRSLSAMTATVAGYERRQEEWTLQKESNEQELAAMDLDITAGEIRLEMAKSDLRNHELQTKHAEIEAEFLRRKFTNAELYNWMSGQLSTFYFESYRLAFDLAKQAEASLREELLDDKLSIIKFGHWDNLKKGLLAGESLQTDLRRLEARYIGKNSRELEITKFVSLNQINPSALHEFRTTRECKFWIPESVYDLDFPGHYARRIKSVSVTIPCVVGPFTSVSARLSRIDDRIRVAANTSKDSIRASNIPTPQTMVTSSGQDDAGIFEFNFRDERYLPFENAGAISRWELKLTSPAEFPGFDFHTISDVIVKVNYLAKEGGEEYTKEVIQNLSANLKRAVNILKDERAANGDGALKLTQAISVSQTHVDQWHRFMNPNEGKDLQLSLKISAIDFPAYMRKKSIRITEIEPVFVVSEAELIESAGQILDKDRDTNAMTDNVKKLKRDKIDLAKARKTLNYEMTIPRASVNNLTTNVVTGVAPNKRLNPEIIRDLVLLIEYELRA